MSDAAPAAGTDFTRAVTAYQGGDLAEAERLCHLAVRSGIEQFNAIHLLAVVQCRLGRVEEALAHYDAALWLQPEAAAALINRARALRQLQRREAALADYDKAVTLQADDAELWLEHADLLDALERYEAALASFDRALALRPEQPQVLFRRGNVLCRLQRYETAVASFDDALAARPDFADAVQNRAVALYRLGRHDEALAGFDRALALRPENAEALSNRSAVQLAVNRPEAALADCDAALRLRPNYAGALCNRGNALQALDRYEEALTAYDAALRLRPDYPEAHSNRGNALQQLQRDDEVLARYAAALRLQPDYAENRHNRSIVLLRRGLFAEGWAEYEWRRKRHDWTERRFDIAEWQGEAVSGKRLLLHAEQGFGDTIQFARFAAVLAARGAAVVLEVQRPLRALMQTLPGIAKVIGHGERWGEADLHVPLPSVPYRLGVDDETGIPAEIPYLAADAARTATWAGRLPAGEFRVGIAWQGNPAAPIDRGRSLPLRAFAPLCRVPGVRLISLQKQHGLEQLATLPPEMTVATLGDEFDAGPDAFVDAAAVMMTLDLVITSDTAIAHLAGALGRPVWVLLQAVPDWRWMMERHDSPWYPTARLFRQRRRGDWDEVMERVATTLADIVTARAAPASHPVGRVDAPAAMSTYVISLARRADRRDRFFRWNADKGIEPHVFDAVDGRTLRRSDLVAEGIIASETLGFSAGALGNAVSHRRLWQTCVERDQPVLIFEDDAVLPSGFQQWLDPVRAEVETDCDILYLGYNRDPVMSIGADGQWFNITFNAPETPFDVWVERRRRWGRPAAHCIADARLVWGTLGYAVSPRGARTLLATCFPLSDAAPVRQHGFHRLIVPYTLDGVINAAVQRGLIRARAIFPPLVIGPNDRADSDVVGPLRGSRPG